MAMNKNVKMCDLIDLNSTDTKGLLNSKLASPLIPVPKDTGNSYSNRFNQSNSRTPEPRNSLENNPFDMVLHKTTEYIQKKDDPFEVTLEKALRPKSRKINSMRTSSLDFADDCNLKQKEPSQKSKLNKTLDESLITDVLNKKKLVTNKKSNENRIIDVNNTLAAKDGLKSDIITNLSFSMNNTDVPVINIQDLNASILSQSVLNGALFETDEELDIDEIKISLQDDMQMRVEGDKSNDQMPSSTTLKLPKFRRSFSQGDRSPKKSQNLNLTSLVESLRAESRCNSTTSSSSFSYLNTGFRKSYFSGSSVFSSLSNISSIPKLNSASSATNSSAVLSNDTMNRTFLESCSMENSNGTNISENTDLDKRTKTVLNKTQFSISDLTDRFNKIKVKASEPCIPEKTENKSNEVVPHLSNESVTILKKDEEYNTNSKLVDIDVFMPEMNNSNGMVNTKSSTSDVSSDSVFLEGNKIDKSIFREAKHLARTFEELALKTSSGSSIDDLITNNMSWTTELLPAFDDEVTVDNLIELPTSPNASDTNSKNEKVSENTKSDSSTEKHAPIVIHNVEKSKKLEMEFFEPIPTEKRITAATLLLDLKKLIETENNMEANQLLGNLEKVLGVNWENNTELLTTCLTLTNNLAKSPQKPKCKLDIIKNVAENNMEYSQEDNLASNSLENIKDSALCANIDFNNSTVSKSISNNRKCLKEINSESENNIPETKSNTEETNKEKKENNFNTQSECKKDSFSKVESNSFMNEGMVLELLANIGKLLAEQSEGHSTSNVLQNIGRVLNSASNNCNLNKNAKTDDNPIEIQQTPKKSVPKLENKSRSSLLSKSANSQSTKRFSLDMDSKKQSVGKNSVKRSMSASQTPPIKSIPSPVMSHGKSTSRLKEVTKRFPSDPEFINPPSTKKVIANSNKSNLRKDTQTKPITLNLHKEKTTVIGTVKTKLKRKGDVDVVNKKGPMKAVLPIGNMQKRESISKRGVIPSTDSVTPPKYHKIISSTPKTEDDKSTTNKTSRSSKPVASSTPDPQNSKVRQSQSQVANSSKKRNFSCDISPVTTRVNGNNSNEINGSPKRVSKLSSPKRTTPKRRPMESGIPRSLTPPVHKRLNSSFDVNPYEHFSVSPQRSYKVSNSLKNSPVSLKKSSSNIQQSPLRENNKITHNVKPINLISKLRRHSTNEGSNVMEKENI